MKKDIIRIAIGVFLLWILPFSGCASSPTSVKQIRLKITFDPPEAGVPVNYKIFSGSETGVYLDTVSLGLVYEYSFIRKYSPGFYAVKAIDSLGRKSEFSKEVMQ